MYPQGHFDSPALWSIAGIPVKMKAFRGAPPAVRQLASLVLVSCTLANRFCSAFVPGVFGRTASAAIGAGSSRQTASTTTTCGLRGTSSGEDTAVSKDVVLARFKKLQVRVFSRAQQ